jgi:anion-transporting  ArsA/GET3 family ATPase
MPDMGDFLKNAETLVAHASIEELKALREVVAAQFAHLPEPERTDRINITVGHMMGDGSALRLIEQRRKQQKS